MAQALELGLQIAVLLVGGCPGALHQGGLEPRCALAKPGGASLAGALVVAGAQSCPRDQMTGGWEPAHIGANFGYDDLSGQVTDAGDAPQQPNRLAKRVEIALHL